MNNYKVNINALIDQNKLKLTPEERAKIVEELLTKFTYKRLTEMTGIPRTTLFYWKKKGHSGDSEITENTYVAFLYSMNKRMNDFANLEIKNRIMDIKDLSQQICSKIRLIKE